MYRVDTWTDCNFDITGLEGKWRFCLKLLQICYIKVLTTQCNKCTGWISGLPAGLLVLGWGKWWFCLKLLQNRYVKVSTARCNNCTGWIRTDYRFVRTGLEGKWRFCLKLLQCCYIKVSIAQCNISTGWIEGMTAFLLKLGWRGNGGSVWRYCSAVTLICLQHSAITVQGGYRNWLQFC